MLTFYVFIISIVLIALLFFIRGREIYSGKNFFLENYLKKSDQFFLNLFKKISYWWSHVNFHNFKLISVWIINSLRHFVISIKRRFDHKQSHFFTQKISEEMKQKGSASFFLKDVADYKKSLREEDPDGRIEQ